MSRRNPKSEEMQIRLLKDGRIVIDGAGLPPRRLRELRDTLKEVLGPAEIYDEERRGSPEAPQLWGSEEEEEKEEDQERDRNNRQS